MKELYTSHTERLIATVRTYDSLRPPFRNLAGWHGTSVESLIHAFKSGRLIGSTGEVRDGFTRPYDVYIAQEKSFVRRNKRLFPPHVQIGMKEAYSRNHQYNLDSGVFYAYANGRFHAFAAILNLPIDNPQQYYSIYEFLHEDDNAGFEYCTVAQFASDFGLREEDVQSAYAIAGTRSGVLLGISDKVADHSSFALGDDEGRALDFRVNYPGLPLKFVDFIVPLGEYEREVLMNLKI